MGFAGAKVQKLCSAAKLFAENQRQSGLIHAGAVFGGVAVVEFAVEILLGGDEGGLGKLLVVAGYFDLLAVLGDFLEVVVERSEFLELFLKVVLHLAGDLVGALGDDANGFIDVAGVFGEFYHVTGDSVKRGIAFLVVHDLCFLLVAILSLDYTLCGCLVISLRHVWRLS